MKRKVITNMKKDEIVELFIKLRNISSNSISRYFKFPSYFLNWHSLDKVHLNIFFALCNLTLFLLINYIIRLTYKSLGGQF